MNPAIPVIPRQPATPSEQLPAHSNRDDGASLSAVGMPNPAQTDDNPDVILGYN